MSTLLPWRARIDPPLFDPKHSLQLLRRSACLGATREALADLAMALPPVELHVSPTSSEQLEDVLDELALGDPTQSRGWHLVDRHDHRSAIVLARELEDVELPTSYVHPLESRDAVNSLAWVDDVLPCPELRCGPDQHGIPRSALTRTWLRSTASLGSPFTTRYQSRPSCA